MDEIDDMKCITGMKLHKWVKMKFMNERQHGWLKFPIRMKFNNMDESDFAYAIYHINEIGQQDLTHGW